MTAIDRLSRILSRLPGVGKKSATRMAYYLLGTDDSFTDSLSAEIKNLKQNIKTCPECGTYTETIPCEICSDPERDRDLICVVEQSQDVQTIDSTGEFNGLFHVLCGVLSPIDGIGPENLNINKLLSRIQTMAVKEVIIATNPTIEGDTTALYLVSLLNKKGVSVSRLASGLPVGGDLEYADRLTLARSLKGRTSLS